MKPIITGRWEIVPRNQAWAFMAKHPYVCVWLAVASITLTAIIIRLLLHSGHRAIRRPVNKTQAQQALENLKN